MIGWKPLYKSQTVQLVVNKMAAKFAECGDELIQNCKEKSTNKNNTVISTNNWLKVWKTWAKQVGYNEDIKSCQAEELNSLLQDFMQQYVNKLVANSSLNVYRMVCSCNSGFISTRKYLKDNKLNSLRSFNFMLASELFTRADYSQIALQTIWLLVLISHDF